jgi:hypothetical protein
MRNRRKMWLRVRMRLKLNRFQTVKKEGQKYGTRKR